MSFDTGRRQLLRSSTLLGLGGPLGLASARAQTPGPAWPARPVKVLCGFPAGGLTDGFARAYSDFLSQKLNQPFTVENRTGAGGFIALEALARSAPDGYTLCVTTQGSVWSSRVLYKKIPFDADRDMTPVTLFPAGALMMAVPTSLPVTNLREWVDYARRNKVAMGTYAPGSVPHMAAENFNRTQGTQIQAVHYKGEAPMWVDVGSGNTQAGIGSYQALAPYMTRGQLRPIAATGGQRSPRLADVPTFVEQGFDGAETRLDGWMPMMAPAGTPQAILRQISDVIVEAADSPKSRALMDLYSIPIKPTGLEEARRRWKDESPQWIKVAAQLGITLD